MAKPSQSPPPSEPKQPELKFRTKPVQERSLAQSWAVLPARTRLRISLAITAFAAMGLFMSDRLEETMPAPKEAAKPSSSSSS